MTDLRKVAEDLMIALKGYTLPMSAEKAMNALTQTLAQPVNSVPEFIAPKLQKAAKLAIDAMLHGGVKEQAVAIMELRNALSLQEEPQNPVSWEFESLGHAMLGEGKPFYLSGQKIRLSKMKPGDRFILKRTGEICLIKENYSIWNETKQRPSRLHKNSEVEPLVMHPKCDDSCMHVCTEGFTKKPNCLPW